MARPKKRKNPSHIVGFPKSFDQACQIVESVIQRGGKLDIREIEPGVWAAVYVEGNKTLIGRGRNAMEALVRLSRVL